MSANGHAVLGPSSAKRWLNCTASPHLIESIEIEEQTSAAAEEGTYCHAVMESLILHNCRVAMSDDEKAAAIKDVLAVVKEGEDKYDVAEMQEHLDPLMQYLYQYQIQYSDLQIHVERRVDLHPVTQDVWGTADIILFSKIGDFIKVIDLKYGRVYVDEVNNWQMMLYFIGAMLSVLRGAPFPNTASIAIYQPRGGGEWHRQWHFGAPAIREFVESTLKPGLEEHKRGGEFRVGEWCEWCPAIAHCGHMLAATVDMATRSFEELDKIEDTEELAKMLNLRKPVAKLMEHIEKRVTDLLTLGQEVPGYKLVESNTKRKWGKPEEEIIAFLRTRGKLKLKDVQVKKLITLTAAEKLVKNSKHIDVEDLQAYIIKPAGSPTLAPESDRRDALDMTGGGFEDLGPK